MQIMHRATVTLVKGCKLQVQMRTGDVVQGTLVQYYPVSHTVKFTYKANGITRSATLPFRYVTKVGA